MRGETLLEEFEIHGFEEFKKHLEHMSQGNEDGNSLDKVSEFYYRNFYEPYGDKADEVFQSILKNAITEGAKGKELIPEQFGVLVKVYGKFKKTFGKNIQVKFHPAFSSGSVVVKVSEINLDKPQLLELKEALSNCNTFEVTPLVSGNVDVGVTVKNLFRKIE